MFSANLTALRKKDGGIRPVAVGNVLRRLAAKVVCYAVSSAVPYELSPIQIGCSVKGRAEAAIHAVRKFVSNKIDSHDPTVLVKLDMKNAFNSVRREHVLQTCFDRTPEIAKLTFLAYSKSSPVIASGHSITSSSLVQQGDPIGPLLFALAVDQIASGAQSEMNVWHLDDTTIGGFPEQFLSDVRRCITDLMRIAIEVRHRKTEIINVGLAAGSFSRVVDSFNILLPELKVTVELLGSPILKNATRGCIMKKLPEYKWMSDRVLLLDGIFLLKKAFSLPRLPSTLRTAPCHHHPVLLAEYDKVTRSTTEKLCNVYFDDGSCLQARPPVRHGGHGLRTETDLALPAFLASHSASNIF